MKWNLKELAEDCVTAYLESKVSGQMKCYSAWDFKEPQFPCVITNGGDLRPVVEEATWHDARRMDMDVAVVTDAANAVDGKGNETISARDAHANAVTLVMDALAVTGLLALINAEATEGIAFSMAQVSDSVSTVDEEHKKLITTITIETIVEPVTGS